MTTAESNVAKVALVTGAAKRIGRVIALELARCGWDIAVHYRTSTEEAAEVAQEIAALGRRAFPFQCELADEAAVRALVPAVVAQFGGLHCIVNSASIFAFDDVAEFSYSQLDHHMHANLAAPLTLARALFEATPMDQQSVVINILDQKLFNPNPDYLSYTLSKVGLHSATTLLAQALAPRVRVVGVAPGLSLVSGEQSEEEFAKAHRVTPLGRSSTPEDIAAAVSYLADAPAVTGTTLIVDGGQHLLPLPRDVMFLAK